jgi:hypothetical protein
MRTNTPLLATAALANGQITRRNLPRNLGHYAWVAEIRENARSRAEGVDGPDFIPEVLK